MIWLLCCSTRFIFLNQFRVSQVGLLPARADVDVDGFQDARPDVHEFVRHMGRAEDDVAFLRFDFTVSNGEQRVTGLQNEDLVVGMHVPPRAFAHLLVGIKKHGDARPETLAVHNAVPQVSGGWPIEAAIAGPIGAGYKKVFHGFIFVESVLCQRPFQ